MGFAALSCLMYQVRYFKNFYQNLTTYIFHWIPKGLYYDMIDDRNDFLFNQSAVHDEVSGYTNQEFFNAFRSNITTLQGYRDNLLQLNNNNQ
jgi:hypothetical protein